MWPLMDLCVWSLKCVDVEGLIGSSEHLRRHQDVGSTLPVEIFVQLCTN